MVFRFLFRFLANNERLVERLSESYPIRRAAQITVDLFYKGKQITEDTGIKDGIKHVKSINFRSFVQRLASNVKEEIEEAKQEFKKKK